MLLLTVLPALGCRSMYYSTMELFGREKRDLLNLKHNLNAQAVGSLRGEAVEIEREISKLITDMNASIAQADEFVKGLE